MNSNANTMFKLLWINQGGALQQAQHDELLALGLDAVTVDSATELKDLIASTQALVLSLANDTAALGRLKHCLGQLGCDRPVICRIDGQDTQLAAAAIEAGAALVLAHDDCSATSWRGVYELLSLRAQQAEFIFVDPVSRNLIELAQRVAQAGVTTLLTGPTGAGKEVLARVLHEASPRRGGPFVALNCAAMPEALIEDMLFGHEKGAFTSALRTHQGVFEQAHGGSLFLDEIGEMPVTLQARLLRVLQERQVLRLGAQTLISVNVRVIAATNKDLKAAIRAREFREDLYFRISTFSLRIPALRERRQDIIPLAHHMLALHAQPAQRWVLGEDAQTLLLQYDWPGNVRELSNVIQRALLLSHGLRIGAEHILFDEGYADQPAAAVDTLAWRQPLEATPAPASDRLDLAVRNSEHTTICAALRSTSSRLDAARALGISPRTLRYKIAQMRQHGFPILSAERG